MRGEWHSGKFNTSLSTVEGNERKRGRKLQQPDKEKGSRQESEAATLELRLQVAAPQKESTEMADCALERRLRDTRSSQLPASFCTPDATAVGPRGSLQPTSNQRNLAQVGSHRHFSKCGRPAKFSHGKGSLEQNTSLKCSFGTVNETLFIGSRVNLLESGTSLNVVHLLNPLH